MAVWNFALLGLPSHRPRESVLQLSDLADHQKDCPLKQIALKINILRDDSESRLRQTANVGLKLTMSQIAQVHKPEALGSKLQNFQDSIVSQIQKETWEERKPNQI